jgi:NAD(P)H-nitrite reductase large subunit
MWGKRVAHGIPIRKIFTSKEEALDVVEKAVLLYREQGKTGERFAQTIKRIGFEDVEAQLLSDDLMDRKQEILDAQLHLAGGATC